MVRLVVPLTAQEVSSVIFIAILALVVVVLTRMPCLIHVLRVTLWLLALHVNTLHLYQILHVLTLASKATSSVRRLRAHLSLVYLLGGLLLLLESHFVKDVVEIYRI